MVSVLIHCVLWADFYPDRCIFYFDDTKKNETSTGIKVYM